jgi:hypothetical protein
LFFIGSEVLRQFWIVPPNSDLAVLHAGGDAAENLNGLHRYLIAPQVWSLSVELIFYALVPALVRLRTIWLFMATAACLIIGSNVGRYLAFWNLLFTTNLWLFLLGMLAYRSLSIITFCRHANIMIAFIPFVYWLAWPLLQNSTFAGWLYSTFAGALLFDAPIRRGTPMSICSDEGVANRPRDRGALVPDLYLSFLVRISRDVFRRVCCNRSYSGLERICMDSVEMGSGTDRPLPRAPNSQGKISSCVVGGIAAGPSSHRPAWST